MVDVPEQQQLGGTCMELAPGLQSSAGGEEEADVMLEDLKMESSASTGTDGAVVTVASRVRGGQANEEPGKKVAPYLNLSSSPRNHSSQGSEEKEEQALPMFASGTLACKYGSYAATVAAIAAAKAANSGLAPMGTDQEDEKKAVTAGGVTAVGGVTVEKDDAVDGMDIEATAETGEVEAYQSGKEIPRCGSENLDSSPDYGRREVSQGDSGHICKHCDKVFQSGRALGGHMRAHSSLIVEEGLADGVMEKKHQLLQQQHQQQQQLSGSLVGNEAPHFFSNFGSGSGAGLATSVKQEGTAASASGSKRSRSNGKAIEGRRSPGARRSKPSSGKRQREVTPKNSGGEIGDIKKEEVENALPVPMDSFSSDDDDGNNDEEGPNEEDGVTDGRVDNVCNVCNMEFGSVREMNSHNEIHPLYALRRNPKRSQRFMDQDFTAEAAAATTVPAKKPSSVYNTEENPDSCFVCGKRFQSWKALFGHMRCHPSRTWRGCRPPKEVVKQQQGTSAGDLQLTRRSSKDGPLPNAASRESDSESEADRRVAAEPTTHVKLSVAAGAVAPAAAAAAAAASDNESDTQSFEEAYLHNEHNVEPQPSSPHLPFMPSKRSRTKRARQSVRTQHSVTKIATVPVHTPAENNEMEHETAMGLMMLKGKEVPKDMNWLRDPTASSARTVSGEGRQSRLESALSETERDDYDDQDDENASGDDDEEYNHKEDRRMQYRNKGKGKLEPLDNVSLCEENEEGGDDCEAGELGAGSAKPKYMCNTCKRVFPSHQALGGHRASHKKVKGCFARTNVSDGKLENPDDEVMSEEFRSEEQLPSDVQEQSQSEGDEKERNFSALSKEDSGEIQNGSSKTKKGHVCTICGRGFDSGQALGGHKRCHYNTKEATSSEATSSTNNTTKMPTVAAAAQHQGGGAGGQGRALKDEVIQRGGATRLDETVQKPEKSLSEKYNQSTAQVRQVKEKCYDLNLPPPPEACETGQPNVPCPPPSKEVELKGPLDFPSPNFKVMTSNGEAAELETRKPKDAGFALRYKARFPALKEENSQGLDGSQDSGLRNDELEISLRCVQRNMGTVEPLSNHEKTHALMVSPVSGILTFQLS